MLAAGESETVSCVVTELALALHWTIYRQPLADTQYMCVFSSTEFNNQLKCSCKDKGESETQSNLVRKSAKALRYTQSVHSCSDSLVSVSPNKTFSFITMNTHTALQPQILTRAPNVDSSAAENSLQQIDYFLLAEQRLIKMICLKIKLYL